MNLGGLPQKTMRRSMALSAHENMAALTVDGPMEPHPIRATRATRG